MFSIPGYGVIKRAGVLYDESCIVGATLVVARTPMPPS